MRNPTRITIESDDPVIMRTVMTPGCRREGMVAIFGREFYLQSYELGMSADGGTFIRSVFQEIIHACWHELERDANERVEFERDRARALRLQAQTNLLNIPAEEAGRLVWLDYEAEVARSLSTNLSPPEPTPILPEDDAAVLRILGYDAR